MRVICDYFCVEFLETHRNSGDFNFDELWHWTASWFDFFVDEIISDEFKQTVMESSKVFQVFISWARLRR